jgi:hypothetical protein
MPRVTLVLVAIAIACGIGAGTAAGDGGPGAGVQQGWDGIRSGAMRYVAVPSVGWTTIEAIRRQDGRVMSFMNLEGSWGVPVVAFDGTPDGLLRDGRTLLLGEATGGPMLRKHSRFVLVDLKKMQVIHRLTLKGHQIFDALSPDGHYLYFIEYTSQQNFTKYRVRAYDFATGRLLANAITDKRDSETSMQGAPVSRTWSQDGTWAYTLYGGSGQTFVHALDTRHAAAVCVDLPWKQPARLWNFRLRTDGSGHLVVRGPHGRALATIDQNSLHVMTFVRNL